MVIRRFGFLSLLLLSLLSTALQARAEESFAYRAYYQGLLSAMARVPIADIRLETQRVAGEPLHISTLSLTSEHHALMDAFYPIRYRLRAIYGELHGQLLAYERYKRTRKVKHDMTLVDVISGTARLLEAEGAGDVAVPEPLRPWLSQATFSQASDKALQVPDGVLDRLTLLQSLRERMPQPGETLQLVVTDGEKLFDYRVVNEGSESLEVAGRQRDCWRLRIEGFVHKSGSEHEAEADHEPVYVWLTTDPQRVPVRFHSDATLGGFTVEWLSEPVAFDVEFSDRPLQPRQGEGYDDA